MFNLKTKKNSKIDESYKYIANSLDDIIMQKNANVLAITSSYSNNFYRLVAENIVKKMISDDTRSLLMIDADVDDDKKEFVSLITSTEKIFKMNMVNVGKKEFKKIICENEANYDIIISVIPQVILKADALEYAKICKNVILIEKYMYSYYEDYENSLLQLKNANINIEGVIACK